MSQMVPDGALSVRSPLTNIWRMRSAIWRMRSANPSSDDRRAARLLNGVEDFNEQ